MKKLLAIGAVFLALAACAGETRPIEAVAAPGDPGGQAYLKECSACHMAYPPQFLPARSWRALSEGLADHFGEDASLDPAQTQRVTAYLVANAADSPSGNPGVLRGLAPGETPIRITDMPFWRNRHHRLLRPGVGEGPGLRTAANCASCHNGRGDD
jgi:mono/diheme cytochrome c family protein